MNGGIKELLERTLMPQCSYSEVLSLNKKALILLNQKDTEFEQLKLDKEWLWEVFLKMEGLSQNGSDMEGHELSYQMCQILHPELYEGTPSKTGKP